jgi:hypothetical protein
MKWLMLVMDALKSLFVKLLIITNNLEFLDDKHNWKNLNCIARIYSERYHKSTGKISTDIIFLH